MTTALIMEISALVTLAVGIFFAGWKAHAFYHDRKHEKLDSEIEQLKKDLKEAERPKVALADLHAIPNLKRF